MKRISLLVIAFLAVSGIVGYVATSGVFKRGAGSSSAQSTGTITNARAPMVLGAPAPAPAHLPASGDQSLAAKAAQASGGGEAVAGSASTAAGTIGAPSVATAGPTIVKTATLSVEVKAGSFQQNWGAASLVAQKYHGFVVSSSTQGSKSKSGNLLIRVPEASFDLAMSDLSGLGSVDSQSVNGQDVTSQFVDLGARLRTWQSQENVLLRLMDRANSIGETMQVQRELQQVQFQIEDIKGQLRMLHDQSSLGTIQLTLHEPGVVAGPNPGAESKPSLARAWDSAAAAFLGVISLVIVGLGYLVPVAVLGGLVWFAYKRFRPKAAGGPVTS